MRARQLLALLAVIFALAALGLACTGCTGTVDLRAQLAEVEATGIPCLSNPCQDAEPGG